MIFGHKGTSKLDWLSQWTNPLCRLSGRRVTPSISARKSSDGNEIVSIAFGADRPQAAIKIEKALLHHDIRAWTKIYEQQSCRRHNRHRKLSQVVRRSGQQIDPNQTAHFCAE
jgi:hypothetical protein